MNTLARTVAALRSLRGGSGRGAGRRAFVAVAMGAMLVGSLFALPIYATPDDDWRHRGKGKKDQRYDAYDRHPDRGRSAGYDARRGYGYGHERLEELAEELEDSTDRLHQAGKHGRFGRRDGRLRILDELEDSADRFEKSVDRHRDPRQSYDDFRRLVSLYHEADDAYYRERNPGVRQELYNVGALLDEVSRAYAYANGRPGTYRDRPRYERHPRRGGHYDGGSRRPGAVIEIPRIRIRLPF